MLNCDHTNPSNQFLDVQCSIVWEQTLQLLLGNVMKTHLLLFLENKKMRGKMLRNT
ncbi:hypothetical protein R5R35_001510 [Gryllus longicercus]|uniref:Uncharacterized protein n=1 Tax=Gryllus longicercus TaxID=2509291 RepID=A0AAN9W7U8_9ORTH